MLLYVVVHMVLYHRYGKYIMHDERVLKAHPNYSTIMVRM